MILRAFVVLVNKGYIAAPKRVVCMAIDKNDAMEKVKEFYKNEPEPVKIQNAHPIKSYEIVEGLPHENQI